MAVSKLMTHGLNRAAVNNSLLALKNYAVEDKGMKVNSYPFLSRLAISELHKIWDHFHVLITFDKSILELGSIESRCSGKEPALLGEESV